MELEAYLQNFSNVFHIPHNHIQYLQRLKDSGFEPKVIYDIGSCVLHWTKVARKLWPNATIILFDAFQPAEFLYKGYDYHIGVLSNNDNDIVKFYQNEYNPGGNSYYREIGFDDGKYFPKDKYIEMKTRTLDSIVKERGFPLPDFVKIDVQGSEVDILQGGLETCKNAKRMIVELQHIQYNLGAPTSDKSLKIIENMGWICTDPLFQNNGPDGDYGFININECKQSNKILLYAGFSEAKWNYSTLLEKGLGGSETCVCRLAKQFPKQYDVYVCGNVLEESIENVTYIHYDHLPQLLKRFAFHTIIVSRYIGFLEDYSYLATYKLFVWCHDTYILPYALGRSINVEGTMKKWDSKIYSYICVSDWHRELFLSRYPFIKNKITVVPNGIDTNSFPSDIPKIPNLFVFTSCPERGYTEILKLWPEICKHFRGAELKLATYVPIHKIETDLLINIYNTPNIEFLGSLSQNKLYELMASADYWLYPTNFLETFCITALEMLHSKTICLYNPIGALNTTIGKYGIKLSQGSEIETLKNIAENNDRKELMRIEGKTYAETFDWKNIYKYWENLLFTTDF